MKNNYILGREQKLTEVDKRDGHVTLLWSNLEAPYATYPYRLCKYPSWDMPMQWIDLYNDTEGFYIGSHDETCETKWFFFELRPCLSSHASTDWPIPEETGKDRPIGLVFSVVRLPYIEGGKNWTSSPVVYRFHRGDWHSGAERYRRWTATRLKFPPKPPWVRDCHSWMTTTFHFPDNSVQKHKNYA